MRYELWISLKYLLAKRKEKFISIISLISVLGVAVGVMALIVVLAVMSGFDNDLRDKIVGTNSHIIIEREGGIEDFDEILKKLEKIPYVLASAPFINVQALIRKEDTVIGVVLRGIDPKKEVTVTNLKRYLIEGDLNLSGNEVIIGKELSMRLNLKHGDNLALISPVTAFPEIFKVRGIFNSGMYEYDLNLTFTDIQTAQRFYGVPGLVGGIGVKIDNILKAEQIKKEIQKELGITYWVKSWMDINKNLFEALKLEKTTMFIILTLIIIVACFNIIGTLIMVVMEKTKDIGILKSIGASNENIRKIFMFNGIIVGLVGTILGACGGIGLSILLKNYPIIKLPRDIYYIDRLPVDIQFADCFAVILAAIIISLLSTLYPANQAARLDPVEALRYE